MFMYVVEGKDCILYTCCSGTQHAMKGSLVGVIHQSIKAREQLLLL